MKLVHVAEAQRALIPRQGEPAGRLIPFRMAAKFGTQML